MDTFQRVKKLLAASIGIPEEVITLTSTLGDLWDYRQQVSPGGSVSSSGTVFDELSLDSLDMVEFIMQLEEFDIQIPEGEADALPPLFFDRKTTVRQIVEFMDQSKSE